MGESHDELNVCDLMFAEIYFSIPPGDREINGFEILTRDTERERERERERESERLSLFSCCATPGNYPRDGLIPGRGVKRGNTVTCPLPGSCCLSLTSFATFVYYSKGIDLWISIVMFNPSSTGGDYCMKI